MSKLLYKLKINSKLIFHSFVQFAAVIFFGWYNNRLFEILVIYFTFFVFRRTFEKQWHAATTWLCTIYTIIIFYAISLIAPSKELSILLIVLSAYGITFLSFCVRDYFDLKDRFKAIKIDIKKGMSRESLLNICKANNLTELETKILTCFYCDKLSLLKISRNIGYSYDYTAELKSNIIKRISKD